MTCGTGRKVIRSTTTPFAPKQVAASPSSRRFLLPTLASPAFVDPDPQLEVPDMDPDPCIPSIRRPSGPDPRTAR
jgi:hypothetical protein